jgi:hypothetical protein
VNQFFSMPMCTWGLSPHCCWPKKKQYPMCKFCWGLLQVDPSWEEQAKARSPFLFVSALANGVGPGTMTQYRSSNVRGVGLQGRFRRKALLQVRVLFLRRWKRLILRLPQRVAVEAPAKHRRLSWFRRVGHARFHQDLL